MVSYLKSDLSNLLSSKDSMAIASLDDECFAETLDYFPSFKSSSSKMFRSSVSSSFFGKIVEESDKKENAPNLDDSDSKFSTNNLSLVDMHDPAAATMILNSSANLPEESFDEMVMSLGKSFQKHMSICSSSDEEKSGDEQNVVRLPLSCLSVPVVDQDTPVLAASNSEQQQQRQPKKQVVAVQQQQQQQRQSTTISSSRLSLYESDDEGLGLDLDELAKHLLPPLPPSEPQRVAASECFCTTSTRCEPPRQTVSAVVAVTPEQSQPTFAAPQAPFMPQLQPQPQQQQQPHQQQAFVGHEQPTLCVSTTAAPPAVATAAPPMMPSPAAAAAAQLQEEYLAAAERLKESMRRSMSSRTSVKQCGGFMSFRCEL